jgi:hypothetical protein
VDKLIAELKKNRVNTTPVAVEALMKDLGITPADLDDETIAGIVQELSTQPAFTTKEVKQVAGKADKTPLTDHPKSTIAQDFQNLATSADTAASRLFRRAQEIADQKTAELEEQLAQQMADKAIAARLSAYQTGVDFLERNLGSTKFLLPAQQYFQLESTDAIEVQATQV